MKDNKIPSPLVSLLPVFVLILLLFVTIRTFGSDALSGGSQVCLLVATAVCVLIGMAGFRRPWKDFELAVTNNIAGVSTALIILLIIGALSGAWMVSGVVPTLIYYGIQVIHPHFFLVSTCIICAVVSVMTGSSWTTIATIGIALMGIGKAQGFSEGWIAGAIISGAYFGDKVSPLSDTTILASSVTDTPLFTHIRYLMITTVPSLVITLIIFTIAGLSHEATDTGHIAEYTRILSDKFHISWWLMIVPVVTAILIARKVPSIITLFVSTALATVFALIFQPGLLCEIAGQGVEGIAALFKGGMGMLYGGTQLETGNAEINELISTRGMAGILMMPEGVELKIRVPHEPLIIRSDHFRLTQVCTNFINNAVKFTAKGYIEIGYELSADGKSILISVKDTGKGIPDDKKEKVFERFQKLDEFAQGTGLGLAICQSIVHTFHGSISLESEVGVGSKFTISLPYTPGLELEERT